MHEKRPIGICKLCETEGMLCQSHIVPEFMYEPVYGNGKMVGFAANRGRLRTHIHQKGLREYLLCERCEGFVNTNYEQPNVAAWKYIRNGVQAIRDLSGVGRQQLRSTLWTVTGVPYPSFKLLMLSIIWRASVAGRSEYGVVDLAEHQEALRYMLISKDPRERLEYPVLLNLIDSNVRLISPPALVVYEDYLLYQMLITNVEVWFFIGAVPSTDPLMSLGIYKDNTLRLAIKNTEESQLHEETFRRLRQMKRVIEAGKI